MDEYTSTFIAFTVINVTIHSLGMCLLVLTNQGSDKTVQHAYLMNLSLSKLLLNVVRLMSFFAILRYYVYYLCNTPIHFLCSFAMLFITGDLLMERLLNVRYSVVWTLSKTKVAVAFSWCFSKFLLIAVIVSFFAYGVVIERIGIHRKNIGALLGNYIPMALSVLFLNFFIQTYLVMLCVKKSQMASSPNQLVYHSLIISYLMLSVIPLMAACILTSIDKYYGIKAFWIELLILLSDTVHGVMYISLYAPARRMVNAKMSPLFGIVPAASVDGGRSYQQAEYTQITPM